MIRLSPCYFCYKPTKSHPIPKLNICICHNDWITLPPETIQGLALGVRPCLYCRLPTKAHNIADFSICQKCYDKLPRKQINELELLDSKLNMRNLDSAMIEAVTKTRLEAMICKPIKPRKLP